MTERTLVGYIFVQARAYDGRKESRTLNPLMEGKEEKKIESIKRAYLALNNEWALRRPRLAYGIRVYLKGIKP